MGLRMHMSNTMVEDFFHAVPVGHTGRSRAVWLSCLPCDKNMSSRRVSASDVQRYAEERERKTTAPKQDTDDAAPQMVAERFVAYISDRKADIGSEQLLNLIEPVREDFRVVNIASLDKGKLPEWLDGTPVLVDARGVDRVAHKGSAALDLVREVYASALGKR